MCGIVGGYLSKKPNKNEINNALKVLRHRGPDNQGSYVEELNNRSLFFGHRRLSIIDLSDSGNQPMSDFNGDLVITYNGEIYNFNEIKKELKDLGYSFRTSSDTEVILKAYHKWGIASVNKFIGMYSIALFDKRKNRLFLIRDRAGVKPLYYYYKNKQLLFGSELKVLHEFDLFSKNKQINLNASSTFLKKGWIPSPHTIFQDTYKLPPGSYLEFDLGKKSYTIIKYWNVRNFFNQPKLTIDYQEAKEELKNLILSASQYRMVSDTPVGIFLSGGYDSSLVTAILQTNSSNPLKTFSIGFEDEKFNEAPYAKKVSEILGTDHNEKIISEQDALDIIDKIPFHYDEPFGDSSAIPTMLVSELAAKKVKVALSADGGDEVFGGYERYYSNFKEIEYLKWLKKIKLGNIFYSMLKIKSKNTPQDFIRLEKVKQGINLKGGSQMYRLRIEPNHFSDFELSSMYKDSISGISSSYDDNTYLNNQSRLGYMRGMEYQTTMVDDILVKVDRASMAYSIESREPLLDHRLIEFSAKLPDDYFHGGIYPKRIIRDLTHDYLPKELMNRAKKGFAIPTEKWMKGALKEKLLYFSSKEFITKQGLFDENAIHYFTSNYLNDIDLNHERPWIFLMHQMWWEKWMM